MQIKKFRQEIRLIQGPTVGGLLFKEYPFRELVCTGITFPCGNLLTPELSWKIYLDNYAFLM